MKDVSKYTSKIVMGSVCATVISFSLPNITYASLINPANTFRKIAYSGCSGQETFGSATGSFDASISNSFNFCEASTSQSTFIGTDSLTGTGSTVANGTTTNTNTKVNSSSRFSFSFDVSEAVFYTLNATVENNGSSPSEVRLSQFIPDPNDEYGGGVENLFSLNPTFGPGLVSSSASGILLPNTRYLFNALSQSNYRKDDIIQTPDINFSSFEFSLNVQPVPLPSAVWLFGSGLIGLICVARRKAVSL